MRRTAPSISAFLLPVLLFSSVFLSPILSAQEAPASVPVLARAHTESFSLGTWIRADLFAADKKTADRAAELFDREIARWNGVFTVHGDGPMNRVNQNAGHWTPVPCEAADLMETAKTVARDSDRAFEPTIGPVVNAWKIGFGGDRVPGSDELKAAAARVDFTRVETDRTPGKCRIRIGADQNVDLGAVAKGWIGTELARRMQEAGVTNALLDLGGNIVLVGSFPEGGRPWSVGIQDPEKPRGQILAHVTVQDESVVTSGDYERNLKKSGKTYGHILDARTGMPSDPQFGSVTVVSENGALADAWCTAFFAMGRDKALRTAAGRPDLKVLLVDADLKNAWVSPALKNRVTVTRPGLVLHEISSEFPDHP